MEITNITKPARKLLKLRPCGAVIVAAGNASRMEGTDKIMADLGGAPVIVRTAQAFQDCDAISEIVVVTRPDLIIPISDLLHSMDKVRAVVAGGGSRQESVELGLSSLSPKMQMAAIHDGARPLVTWQLIDRVVRAANTYGAAAPAVPVKDTIKVVSGGVVERTPDRSKLQAVQTPQVLDFDLLRAGLKKAAEEGKDLTDDCAALENMGFVVKIVQGDERNMKITTPMDLKIANLLWEEGK